MLDEECSCHWDDAGFFVDSDIDCPLHGDEGTCQCPVDYCICPDGPPEGFPSDEAEGQPRPRGLTLAEEDERDHALGWCGCEEGVEWCGVGEPPDWARPALEHIEQARENMARPEYRRYLASPPPPTPPVHDCCGVFKHLGHRVTCPEGWPASLPDDRVAIGDDEPIPPPPPPPDVLGAIYADKRNVLAGEPGCGKTWLALECAAEIVKGLGRRVVWLDAEDSAATFSERMARLGHRDLTRSPMLKRVNHGDWLDAYLDDRDDDNDGPGALQRASEWLGDGHLFIDSGTASESGVSADEYAAWLRRHAVHHAMTVIEHVAKNPEQRFGPLGSTRKNQAQTGITAMIEGAAWTPSAASSVNLRVVKDRPGGTGRQKGQLYATVYGDPHHDGSLTITVRPPIEESDAYLVLVLSAVEDDPGIGSRDLRDRVSEAAKMGGLRSDWQTITAEIKEAIRAGHVVKHKGNGNRVHHYPADPE